MSIIFAKMWTCMSDVYRWWKSDLAKNWIWSSITCQILQSAI